MSDYQSTPHELDWDAEITSDAGNFVLLEEGDYDFTVTAFERGRYQPKEKSKIQKSCGKAILTLSVDTPAGPATVKYDLILYSTLEWKLSEFFRAIGQKKRGEPLRPRWNEVVGSHGRAHFKPRSYIDKRTNEERLTNDVEKFYDFDEETVRTAPQWRQESMGMPQANPWASGRF